MYNGNPGPCVQGGVLDLSWAQRDRVPISGLLRFFELVPEVVFGESRKAYERKAVIGRTPREGNMEEGRRMKERHMKEDTTGIWRRGCRTEGGKAGRREGHMGLTDGTDGRRTEEGRKKDGRRTEEGRKKYGRRTEEGRKKDGRGT
jgi:hypothetical protein